MAPNRFVNVFQKVVTIVGHCCLCLTLKKKNNGNTTLISNVCTQTQTLLRSHSYVKTLLYVMFSYAFYFNAEILKYKGDLL